MFRNNLSVPYSRVNISFFLGLLPIKNRPDSWSRNVGKKLPLCAERRSHAKLTHVANTVLSVKTVNNSGNRAAIKLNLGLYSYWSGDIHNFIKILIFTEFD
jgi:hypothetical protein